MKLPGKWKWELSFHTNWMLWDGMGMGSYGNWCMGMGMVTGQLADTPTRGLPTRGLDISRMPPATLRA